MVKQLISVGGNEVAANKLEWVLKAKAYHKKRFSNLSFHDFIKEMKDTIIFGWLVDVRVSEENFYYNISQA